MEKAALFVVERDDTQLHHPARAGDDIGRFHNQLGEHAGDCRRRRKSAPSGGRERFRRRHRPSNVAIAINRGSTSTCRSPTWPDCFICRCQNWSIASSRSRIWLAPRRTPWADGFSMREPMQVADARSHATRERSPSRPGLMLCASGSDAQCSLPPPRPVAATVAAR